MWWCSSAAASLEGISTSPQGKAPVATMGQLISSPVMLLAKSKLIHVSGSGLGSKVCTNGSLPPILPQCHYPPIIHPYTECILSGESQWHQKGCGLSASTPSLHTIAKHFMVHKKNTKHTKGFTAYVTAHSCGACALPECYTVCYNVFRGTWLGYLTMIHDCHSKGWNYFNSFIIRC